MPRQFPALQLSKWHFTLKCLSKGGSGGYGSRQRLMFRRSWVLIPGLSTGWTHFHIFCGEICNVCLKRRKNEIESGDGPFLKNAYPVPHVNDTLSNSFFSRTHKCLCTQPPDIPIKILIRVRQVHPDFHWLNSFATNFREFHWHETYIDSTWHGYTKGVSMVITIATSN